MAVGMAGRTRAASYETAATAHRCFSPPRPPRASCAAACSQPALLAGGGSAAAGRTLRWRAQHVASGMRRRGLDGFRCAHTLSPVTLPQAARPSPASLFACCFSAAPRAPTKPADHQQRLQTANNVCPHRAQEWPVAVAFFHWSNRTRRSAASRAYAVRVAEASGLLGLVGCLWRWHGASRLVSPCRVCRAWRARRRLRRGIDSWRGWGLDRERARLVKLLEAHCGAPLLHGVPVRRACAQPSCGIGWLASPSPPPHDRFDEHATSPQHARPEGPPHPSRTMNPSLIVRRQVISTTRAASVVRALLVPRAPRASGSALPARRLPITSDCPGEACPSALA